MKNITAAISILLAFLASSQVVKSTNATAPNFADGTVSVDTTGTSLKKWSIYRVSNSAIQGTVVNSAGQGKELETNFKTKSGLTPGTYWVLGKKQDDGLAKFSLDTLIDISIAVAKDCDSLKVDYLNAMQQPDPTNPQNPLTCLAYSVSKANGYAAIDKVYMKNWDNTFAQYQLPVQGGCLSYVPYDSKLYVVFTDASGCSVVGKNYKENKPTGVPIMVVPGTEPGPIANYFTYGFADCSGYYINYNNTQYKICNYATAQAAGIVHLAPIIVSGKFLSDCGDNTPVCQMYHPYEGLFWLDSVSAIPNKPTSTNCWDDFQFNTATLVWENKGSKPAQPTATNCWDSYQFSSTSCSWENKGTIPAQPLAVSCWDNYQFNSTNCSWENKGVQPAQPTATNCWDSYQFNSTSCSWENKGTQPTKPSSANCWDSYQFDGTSCSWENKGSQPAMPSDTVYVYQFDSASCAWDNIGLKDSSKLSIGTVDIKAAFWPNPFGDRIEVGLSPGYFGTLTTIEGKAIRRFESGGGPIDTKDLQPGTYFINIEGNRQSISLKAIKQ